MRRIYKQYSYVCIFIALILLISGCPSGPIVLTVTLDAQGGTVAPGSILAEYSHPYGELPIPERENYSFDGWWTGTGGTGSQVVETTEVIRKNNHAIYAKWIGDQYMVTFDMQGGSGGTSSVTVTFGSSMPLVEIAPTLTGYAFEGYYDDIAGTGIQYYTADLTSVRAYDKDQDGILYARWFGPVILQQQGPAGGLVFYDKGHYSDGWRYLESAPVDYEWSSKRWTGYGTLVGGTGTAIGKGKSNTEKILARLESENSAAKVCKDLVMTKEGALYDDWFLPSKDELNQMYFVLKENSLGDFANGNYWSSSENGSYYAWLQYFYDGYQYGYLDKTTTNRVRAVRSF